MNHRQHRREGDELGPIALSLRDDFRLVEGLGAELPVVLTAKAAAGGSYRRARYRVQREVTRAGGVFHEQRRALPGFIRFGRLARLLAGDASHPRNLDGLEPYDFVSYGEQGIFAFHDDDALRVVDLRSGERLRSLREVATTRGPMGLYNVHTLQLHPRDPGRLLIANSGLDRAIEIDLASARVTWEWCPWQHGWRTNAHGLTLVERGEPVDALALRSVERLAFDEAQDRVRVGARPPSGAAWVHEVPLAGLSLRLGLEKWQRVKLVNSAYYDVDGSAVLLTFWQTGEAAAIDRDTGRVSVIAEGLGCPHSFAPTSEGYVLTDTLGARVLRFDDGKRRLEQIDFSACPLPAGADPDAPEWLQNTHSLTHELLASFDFRRSRVVVWEPAGRRYSVYPVDPEWVLQSIQPLHPDTIEVMEL